MITKIIVEELDPEKFVMVADGIEAKKAEDRLWQMQEGARCNLCTFNFATI